MQFITKFTKTSIVIGGVVVAGIIFGLQNSGLSANQSDSQVVAGETETVPEVSLVSASRSVANTIATTGEVLAKNRATISAQTSGVIERTPVEIGDRVSRGDVIAEFNQMGKRADLKQALAGLKSATAQLEKLKAGPREEELENSRISVAQSETTVAEARENLEDTKKRQKTLVENARENLLNTDLQAYFRGDESNVSGSLTPPTISGTYKANERGEYIIELYQSNAESGYSFRYRGLEQGVGTVTTQSPQKLGSRGLFIEFPQDFAKSRTLEWVVPIPNKRSDRYQAAKNRLENAKENRERAIRQAETRLERAKQSKAQAKNKLDIATEGARSQQIMTQEGQVESARANVLSAKARLDEASVQAPFSGTVLSRSVSAGEYLSRGQPVAKLVSKENLEVRVSVAKEAGQKIKIGDQATVADTYTGAVTAKAPAVDRTTGNVEVRIRLSEPASKELVSGTFVDVSFKTAPVEDEKRTTTLPLSAVGTSGGTSYVLVVNDKNVLEKREVSTGRVNGETVVITSDVPETVVADISGLSVGQSVRVTQTQNE
jgi:RND family efflux transporter MFP subunit